MDSLAPAPCGRPRSLAVAVLAAGLSSLNQILTSLNVSGNKLGASGAQSLSHALMTCRVKKLRCHGNEIGDEGAKDMAQCIGRHPFLEYVGMMDNNIGDSGGFAIFNYLGSNRKTSKLVQLGLNGNHIGDHAVGQAVCRVLRSDDRGRRLPLRNLGLGKNKITQAGMTKLTHLIKDEMKAGVDVSELPEILLLDNPGTMHLRGKLESLQRRSSHKFEYYELLNTHSTFFNTDKAGKSKPKPKPKPNKFAPAPLDLDTGFLDVAESPTVLGNLERPERVAELITPLRLPQVGSTNALEGDSTDGKMPNPTVLVPPVAPQRNSMVNPGSPTTLNEIHLVEDAALVECTFNESDESESEGELELSYRSAEHLKQFVSWLPGLLHAS